MTVTVTQLGLFNGALRLLGERKLASLSEAREPQRVLTDIWNDGSTQAMLEKGFWKFAIRSSQLTYSPSITPPFGYQFAFNKNSDWVRTAAVCSDPYYNQPLTQYEDEAGYLFANLNTIYVKYVSNDASYGNNYSLWTAAFVDYYHHYLAWKGCYRITQSKEKEEAAFRDFEKAGITARSLDAMDGPAKFMPMGTWVGARRGRSISRRRENDNSQVW